MARELQKVIKFRELKLNEINSKETKIIQITEFYKLLFVSLEIWDNITFMEKKQVIGIFLRMSSREILKIKK